MAQIQFQLNRLPLVEMHLALDLLPTLDLVFPSATPQAPAIPWTPGKQWAEKLDARLAQRVSVTSHQLPPDSLHIAKRSHGRVALRG